MQSYHRFTPSLMTLRTTFLFLLLICTTLSWGQDDPPMRAPEPFVGVELKSNSVGSEYAFTTTIPEANEEQAADAWKRFIKDHGAKAKRSRGEKFKTEEVVINSIGGNELLSVYIDLEEETDAVKAYIWIRDNGAFLDDSSGDRTVAAVEKFVREYHYDVLKRARADFLSEEERTLSRVEKDVTRATRTIESNERAIERAKQTIEHSEKTIEETLAELKLLKEQLEKQAQLVEEAKQRLADVRG